MKPLTDETYRSELRWKCPECLADYGRAEQVDIIMVNGIGAAAFGPVPVCDGNDRGRYGKVHDPMSCRVEMCLVLNEVQP